MAVFRIEKTRDYTVSPSDTTADFARRILVLYLIQIGLGKYLLK